MDTSELAIAGYNFALREVTLVEKVEHDAGAEIYQFIVRKTSNDMQKVCVSYSKKKNMDFVHAASKEEAEQFIYGVRRAIVERIDALYVV